jgi:hypothetical protein
MGTSQEKTRKEQSESASDVRDNQGDSPVAASDGERTIEITVKEVESPQPRGIILALLTILMLTRAVYAAAL